MDCGDNSCFFVKGDERHGMRTNGGCRCLSDLPREKQRELKQFVFEIRAESSRLAARVAELEGLLREVSTAGVELDDPRIGYLTVQIDRDTWSEIKEAVERLLKEIGE